MATVDRKVNRRPYDNSGRDARSRRTRRRILDAARELMTAHGYASTTVAEIARRAAVHPDTVYQLVGRKPMLLRELVEHAISGTDHPVDAEQRDYVAAIRAEPDPRAKLAIYAEAITTIHQRLAPLLVALREAAGADADAETVWRDVSDRRAANMRRLVADLDEAGGLRHDVTVDDAADTIWLTNSAETYLMLVDERGWSAERYERWLRELWSRYLLPNP
jgi:AcrR family transcriptional regulator